MQQALCDLFGQDTWRVGMTSTSSLWQYPPTCIIVNSVKPGYTYASGNRVINALGNGLVPRYYVNQCWLVANWTLRNAIQITEIRILIPKFSRKKMLLKISCKMSYSGCSELIQVIHFDAHCMKAILSSYLLHFDIRHGVIAVCQGKLSKMWSLIIKILRLGECHMVLWNSSQHWF